MTDEEIIQAFRTGGTQANKAWTYCLKHWRGKYRRVISSMGGTEQEADDALMSVAFGFQRAVSSEIFKVQFSLEAYLTRSVVNWWLNMKKTENKLNTLDLDGIEGFSSNQAEAESALYQHELKRLLDHVITQAAGARCLKILGLFGRDFSMREIAEEMGFKRPDNTPNDDTAKNEKSGCQKKVRAYFIKHPQIAAQLKSYLNHE
ncbi:MAG: sigma-70 family RNA polymerase sigma factor [Saprospiraceae bacterium]|nr:sigma-70 family RNA polymerase sigma factor [Saprospiraceae bacterium]